MKAADPDLDVLDLPVGPLGESVSVTVRHERGNLQYRRASARYAVAEQVARALIRFRGDRRLSQRAAARLLEMTESMVSRLERGDHVPNVDTMLRVAEATGTVLRVEFVGRDEGRGG
jgi:ribosome-binding protein aMBF1 (putative translation factor)